ncbi:hypothetical protein DRN70_02555 [Methanosarcinales archaeon]|nr:MAG: hypothetical protein DRN70_02555 [Methanosarcinales archaeon]
MGALNCAGCGVCCTSPIPPAFLRLIGIPVEGVDETRVQYFNDVLLFPHEIKALVERGYSDAIQLYGIDERFVIFRLFSPLTILDFTNFDPKDFPIEARKGDRWVGLSCIFQDVKTAKCVIHADPDRPEYCDIYPVRIESCPPHRITGKYTPKKLNAIENWKKERDAGEYLVRMDTRNLDTSTLTTKTMVKLLSKITGINANKIKRLRNRAYEKDPIAKHMRERFREEQKLMELMKQRAKMNYWIEKYE